MVRAGAKRNRPEFDGVVVPIKKRTQPERTETIKPILREMALAGFSRVSLGRVRVLHGRHLSAVTAAAPDLYFFHPTAGISLFVEAKRRKGSRAQPGQEAFVLAHRNNPTRAFIWSDPVDCEYWLTINGFREIKPDGSVRYPEGVHAERPGDGQPIEWERM